MKSNIHPPDTDRMPMRYGGTREESAVPSPVPVLVNVVHNGRTDSRSEELQV